MNEQTTQAGLVVAIMAGGAGTRFWPLSTPQKPKQFLCLFGTQSLLQLAYERALALTPPERILILTGASFVPLVAEQLPLAPAANIIGEPVGRDTAGAVALAALVAKTRFGDCPLAVITADHLIRPTERFAALVQSAARAAMSQDALYTFGIVPNYPATGYGYLEAAELVLADGDIRHYALRRFKEKPSLTVAEEFLADGHFFWNSGMFVWRTSVIWQALCTHLPQHTALLEPLAQSLDTPAFESDLACIFPRLERISIDFAVMEKASDVRMVCADFTWSDVGGWLALEDFYENSAGNRARGLLHAHEATNNFVFCEDEGETVALVGVENLVVVRAQDRTLVASRERLEDIKKLVLAMPKKP